jgi:hypothetical protein
MRQEERAKLLTRSRASGDTIHSLQEPRAKLLTIILMVVILMAIKIIHRIDL